MIPVTSTNHESLLNGVEHLKFQYLTQVIRVAEILRLFHHKVCKLLGMPSLLINIYSLTSLMELEFP